MPFDRITYKSFCWCFGTTSFRTRNFNRSIEEQLSLLNQFWEDPQNANKNWGNNNELQKRYYYFLQEKGFVAGNAPRPDKDAREKTSGLEDIGLIDANKRLTEAGTALLKISLTQDFESDNILKIDKDSFIYLKQLLKSYFNVDTNIVRPLIVLLKVLLDSRLNGYLTKDEFTYILPLCINKQKTEDLINDIVEIRNGTLSIDSAIMEVLLNMNNYKRAKALFVENSVTPDLISAIGMNRKSGKYDFSYYEVYNDLYEFFFNKDTSVIKSLLKHLDKLTRRTAWKKLLFTTSNKRAIINDPIGSCNTNAFTACSNETEFKEVFFNTMHLLKAKATLSDYYDLNKRYLSTADILLFEDERVSLDVIPKQFFISCAANLYELAFSTSNNLMLDCALSEISPALQVSENTIIEGLKKEYQIEITGMEEAMSLVEKQRYERLNNLIDSKFSDNQLVEMLHLLDRRDDDTLMSMVTDNADAPTIFEYILGILWYKLSGRNGKILEYLKLSLDSNLLPKTHAGGGEADIVYEYDATEEYPAHCLLIEATLADKTNQRRMELEPVSRHLGCHLISTRNPKSYCVFATNILNPNVISDFRQRKDSMFFDTNDTSRYIKGMKIIPLETEDLRKIIEYQKNYPELYAKFERAYQDNKHTNPIEWWKKCVRESIVS